MPTLKKAGETRGFCSIGKYIQGPGEIERLPDYTGQYGTHSVVLIDPFFVSLGERLKERFQASGQRASITVFTGECSDEEIVRVTQIAKEFEATCIVGIGGGKTLDTVRAIAADLNIGTMICPTAASSDAPTSGLSVVYRPDHTCRPVTHNKHPEYVLVDTDIIVQAPPRMFAAGLGDALATYFEAEATYASHNVNNFGEGYAQTLTAMAIARLCFDTLMDKGAEAYAAAAHHIRTQAFEDVVEANTLMSGLGTENTGCNIAHGICVSLATVPDTHKMMHGELVAFGTLCQLVIENAPSEQFNAVYTLCKVAKLPISLADLGIVQGREEKVRGAMEYGMENKVILQIPNYVVNQEKLYHAIMYVDSLANGSKN